jgi:hypothetical protein
MVFKLKYANFFSFKDFGIESGYNEISVNSYPDRHQQLRIHWLVHDLVISLTSPSLRASSMSLQLVHHTVLGERKEGRESERERER